jgi:hypothetical protein
MSYAYIYLFFVTLITLGNLFVVLQSLRVRFLNVWVFEFDFDVILIFVHYRTRILHNL